MSIESEEIKEYLSILDKQNQNYIGVLVEQQREDMKAVKEMFSFMNDKLDRHEVILDSHTEMIGTLMEDVSTLMEDVSILKEDVSILKSDMKEVKSELKNKTNTSDFIDLKQQVSELI